MVTKIWTLENRVGGSDSLNRPKEVKLNNSGKRQKETGSNQIYTAILPKGTTLGSTGNF